ncbi:hypothetical protein [Ktedonobacter robiniae]|uniref:SRPBCC family protein n=1 Tax=Ktedonobacter robiniae TaxID=2778365 RepID=A0ABQ3UPI3_9CHLR|nr:hypothetical protein [Ktedonobacter robiniae]GHO54586.1 hypothetical protein KSB_30610 [Ktedonobacter robiniae]
MKTLPRSLASTWGTTAAERTISFPCDHYLTPFDAAYFRAVPVQAPAPIVFRWLCQLRVAPYSYDWIDNGGHLSPRELIPGLDQLQVGQSMCTIFQLVDFEPNRHLTLRLSSPRARAFFGEVTISYVILPQEDAWCRLVVKLLVCYPPGFTGAVMRPWLPWGDLFMMRKQLLTLKHLAERQSKEILWKIPHK